MFPFKKTGKKTFIQKKTVNKSCMFIENFKSRRWTYRNLTNELILGYFIFKCILMGFIISNSID